MNARSKSLYEVNKRFFAFVFSVCRSTESIFSLVAYVLVKGKIVSLQAIVPRVGVSICRFSIQNLTYEQPLLLSKFQPQLLQIQQCFLMCELAEY